jgi:hypothetical protein
MDVAAAILSYESTVLTFAETGRLACLYVIVDGRGDRHTADFLNRWHGCCDLSHLDWQAVRRPASALVGIELGHCCGQDDRLRLVFDVQRDRGALDCLAATEAIVVGTRPYGSFANLMAAYGVDGSSVRQAVQEAEKGLRQLSAAS